MGWKRDPNVTIPQIWRQFERKDKKTGEVMKFQIQDATFDMIPDITKIMLEFLKEEPVAQCFDMANDPESIKCGIGFYSYLVSTGTVLVCVKINDDGSCQVVGCNMTLVQERGDDYAVIGKSKNISEYIRLFHHLEKSFYIFDEFQVEISLKAAGLSVIPEFRGLGIAVELLEARTELCKALKIPLTATEFTSAGGQASARKAGYTWVRDVQYADLMKELPEMPLTNIKHPFTSLMYKKIDLE